MPIHITDKFVNTKSYKTIQIHRYKFVYYMNLYLQSCVVQIHDLFMGPEPKFRQPFASSEMSTVCALELKN